jgi:hypothetical protein
MQRQISFRWHYDDVALCYNLALLPLSDGPRCRSKEVLEATNKSLRELAKTHEDLACCPFVLLLFCLKLADFSTLTRREP